jgi:hypothetical protein
MSKTNVAGIALYAPVLAEFDSPERVLSILQNVYLQDLRTSTVRLFALWYPVMSEVRQLPEFKKLVSDLNLVEYWRAYGWADACVPLGDDDFECI